MSVGSAFRSSRLRALISFWYERGRESSDIDEVGFTEARRSGGSMCLGSGARDSSSGDGNVVRKTAIDERSCVILLVFLTDECRTVCEAIVSPTFANASRSPAAPGCCYWLAAGLD